jgi:cytochrome c5
MIERKRSGVGYISLILVAFAIVLAALPLTAAEKTSPLAEGRALFEKTCKTCHGLDKSLGKTADRGAWKSTIDRMIANGARIDESQTEMILGYLTAKSTFETKCNTCHDLDRPLTAIKSPELWRETVLRMSAMKQGHINDAEAGAITLYLSLVTPAKKGE